MWSCQWFVFVCAILKGKEESWGTVGCQGGRSGALLFDPPSLHTPCRLLGCPQSVDRHDFRSLRGQCPGTGPEQSRHFWARVQPEGSGLPAFAFLIFSKADLPTREGSKSPGGSSIVIAHTRTNLSFQLRVQDSPGNSFLGPGWGPGPNWGQSTASGIMGGGGREGDCGLCQTTGMD